MLSLKQKSRTDVRAQEFRKAVHHGEDGHDVSVVCHEKEVGSKVGWKWIERWQGDPFEHYISRQSVNHVCCDGASRSGTMVIRIYSTSAYKCMTCEQKWIPTRDEEDGGWL